MNRIYALLLPALVAGCAHVSPTDPPAVRDLSIAGWEGAASAADAQLPNAWWSSFGDPVLDSLVASGLAHNVDLRIVAQRVLAARALRRSARSGLFPEIGGAAGTDLGRGGNSGDTVSVGLNVAWEPDISGRLSAAVRAASADAGATAADARAVRLLLVEEIARAYVDYRLRRALILLTEQTVVSQEETLRITRDRFEFGMANALDVERAAALVAQTRSEVAVATEGADAARFQLSYLLSETPADLAATLGPAGEIPSADPLEVLRSPASVLTARPDVAAAAARYAAFAARRDGAAALRFPSLSLSGLVGLDSGGVGNLLGGIGTIASIAAGLAVPVLDFGRRAAELDVADARLAEAGFDYERVVRGALRDTQTAVVSYLQGQVRERELARAAEAARRAAALSRLQFREGTLSQLEVLDSARTVFQAERDHAGARADVSLRLASLFRQMGVAPEPSGADILTMRDGRGQGGRQ